MTQNKQKESEDKQTDMLLNVDQFSIGLNI